jgi:hypothetical protein
MKKLKDYIKPNAEKLNCVTTSIQLEREQLNFVRKLNINLSKLVRDVLKDLMKGDKNERQD